MKRTFVAIAMSCLLALVAPGSTNATTGPTKARVGTVTGTFRMISAALTGMNRGVPGIITFIPGKNNSHRSVKVTAHSSGGFTARLSDGAWSATGQTPFFNNSQSPCGESAFVVKSGQRLRISVQCLVP